MNTHKDQRRANRQRQIAGLLWCCWAVSGVLRATGGEAVHTVPGVVIAYSPAASGRYIGSPSLAVLPGGAYVASHDFFGPQSGEHEKATTMVYRSDDRGNRWSGISTVHGAFWSTLFVHRGVLYLIGPDRHHGSVLIRRSDDGGHTWTEPMSAATGQLTEDDQYHCAPMPVFEHQGRLWRPMERRIPPNGWGITYCAGVLSAAVDADLLDRASWTFSEFLPGRKEWLGGGFGGWLEGNAVVDRSGRLLDMLRVDTPGLPEKAALVTIQDDGRSMAFSPDSGFVDFPGGAKKFTVRFDPVSDRYWSLATVALEGHVAGRKPARVRNTLALTSSPDLREWTVERVVLSHPDVEKHGFQYVDWRFEGGDLIAACRTAFDDGIGGAHNNHDANYLTFHRFTDFRSMRADERP